MAQNLAFMNTKTLLGVISFVFVFIGFKPISAQTSFSGDVVYTIPKSGSFYNSTNTTILIKFNAPIFRDSLAIKSSVVILDNGAFVNYSVIFPADASTIILKPLSSFLNNSKIMVMVDNNLTYLDSRNIASFIFSFYTVNDNEIVKVDKTPSEFPDFINVKNITKTEGLDSTNTLINTINNQFPISILANNGEASGYYFVSSITVNPSGQNRLLILNNKGEIIFERLANGYVLDFKKLNDTTFSYFSVATNSFVLLDMNFNIIKQITAGNGYSTDNHELRYDDKTGNYLILAYHNIMVNMSDSLPGGSTNATVFSNIIQEIDKDNNVVFEWKTIDYLPIMASKGVNLYAANIDYIHCNAIEIDSDSNLMLSSRHLNEIEKINRTNGDLMWRFGLNSSNNDFVIINDDLGFTYQHDIRRLPNGNITLFDNGNLRQVSAKYSRAVEYRLDEVNRTAELVWEYRNKPDIYSGFMGSVQRYPNGNTLIGWGGTTVGTFTEIDKNNNKVLEVSIPKMYSYRAFNYDESAIAKSNLIDLQNPVALNYCNEDSVAIKNSIPNLLIPTNTNENVSLLSTVLIQGDTAVVYSKTSNDFFAKSKTYLNFIYTKLHQKDTLICLGKTLAFSLDNLCSSANIRWFNNDSNIAALIKPDSSAYYWVDITNGSYHRRDSVFVEVSSIPALNILGTRTFTQPYAVFTYSLPSDNNYNYQWNITKGNIIYNSLVNNAIQVQMDSAKSTQLSVVITNKDGCVSNESISISFMGASSSVLEAQLAKNIQIYPNPTNGLVNINAPDDFMYKIIDATGKELLSSSNKVNGSIDLSNLNAGLYTLVLNINNQTLNYRIQKN